MSTIIDKQRSGGGRAGAGARARVAAPSCMTPPAITDRQALEDEHTRIPNAVGDHLPYELAAVAEQLQRAA